MKKHGFITTIILLLLLLVFSGVYAGLTRSVEFSGSAVIHYTPQLDLNLDLMDPSIGTMRPGESITLDTDNKTLNVYVILTQPGDQRLISFQIENTGAIPAQLYDMLPQNPAYQTGVNVIWPSLNGTVLMPEATSEIFSLLVYWEPGSIGASQGDVSFQATVRYTQYTEE